ncbi:MAG: signal peptidase II [Bifidobacteriaceae bacterium]|jgi:signal peptidase II|nr:signal peptidase II [Bifidobacteriaceae bacterium]
MTQASTGAPAPLPATPPGRGRLVAITAIAAVAFALDQITKVIAVRQLAGGQVVPVLAGWLELRLVRNPGAAFSLGESLTWAFTILAAGVVVAVAWVGRRVQSRAWAATLGLLAAGAAGNLADRLFRAPGFGRGHVVDFIDYAGYFVGNVADIAIVGAMVLMVVGVIRGVGLDGARR